MTTVGISELVVGLMDPACLDADLVGGKAAALARAAQAGLPVLDARVLTTTFTAEIDRGADLAGHPAIAQVLARFGDLPMVVRSSSTAEDLAASSMAGRFESVLNVVGGDEFVAAVRTVLDSRQRAAEGSELADDHPIAVLVQKFMPAQTGGVLFGVDPVSGRSDRLVVAAGEHPEEIVSGTASGVRNELDHSGGRTDKGGPTLRSALRRDLAALAERTAEVFGGPQDMEWMVDAEGTLLLLQSRPVTTLVRGVPAGPFYGPGPVAETFPDPLSILERDLWVPPLRKAMREALVLSGTCRAEDLEGLPVVVAPGGRVAVDLEITGEVRPRKRSLWNRVNPVPAARRLRSAWHIGRLRAALPEIALDLAERTDHELRGVPDVVDLTDRQLVSMLGRCRHLLMSLHAHEILMGLLVDRDLPEVTGASVALRVLSEGRRDGRDDADIVAENPIVLALVPPRVGPRAQLPETTPELLPPAARRDERAGVAGLRREALRLRVRWVQELTALAAWEMGVRMAAAGQIPSPQAACHMHLEDLRLVFLRWREASRLHPADDDVGPLPGTFQLSDLGMPIAVHRQGFADEAVGAGGGLGRGVVTHDIDDPPRGSILVVTTLRPELAPKLERLGGLVAETGSPLAHLAILAREAGLPTVVGVADAVNRFPEGLEIELDGHTGQIKLVEPDAGGPDDRSSADEEEQEEVLS
jgi:phosphohistidine swiveling domain-containing protein